LTTDLVMYPQQLINVKVERGFDWQAHEGLARARALVEAELGDGGRVLIRPSGTEPLLRVMVEARSESDADRLARRLADAVSG
jgi:phosphoglucosamine mutase